MPNYNLQLNSVFQALSDPTRRAVLRKLSEGPAAMSDLARPFEMALPSFSQHLDVLEDCGLVSSKKNGRVRTYQMERKTVEMAENWLAEQRVLWERRLDQLDNFLLKQKESKK